MSMLGLALTCSLVARDATHLCSLRQSRSFRPRSALEFTLRATTDSLPEVIRPPVSNENIGHRQPLSWDTATVYAQIFNVLQIGGDLGALNGRTYSRIAVVGGVLDCSVNA